MKCTVFLQRLKNEIANLEGKTAEKKNINTQRVLQGSREELKAMKKNTHHTYGCRSELLVSVNV